MKKSNIEKRMLIGIEIIITMLIVWFLIFYPEWKAEQEVNLEFADFNERLELLRESISDNEEKLEEIKEKFNKIP